MYLSKHDLKQMDEDWLKSLPPAWLLEVSKRLLADVKTLQDRLNQNPSNSSRPPSSQAPWEKSSRGAKAGEVHESDTAPESASASAAQEREGCSAQTESSAPKAEVSASKASTRADRRRRAGKQPGSQGYGRTQKLALTDTCTHRPPHCTACGAALPVSNEGRAYTGWDEVDRAPREAGELGLRLIVTRHRLLELRCGCGHVSRARPWRAADEALWENVTPGQWRLIGPQWAALIVLRSLRMRLVSGSAFRSCSTPCSRYRSRPG